MRDYQKSAIEQISSLDKLVVPNHLGKTLNGMTLLHWIKELVDLVADDTLGPATVDDRDEDSVGWAGDGKELPMTFGHVRRARQAIDILIADAERAV